MSSYIEEVNEGEKRRNQMSLNQSSGNSEYMSEFQLETCSWLDLYSRENS